MLSRQRWVPPGPHVVLTPPCPAPGDVAKAGIQCARGGHDIPQAAELLRAPGLWDSGPCLSQSSLRVPRFSPAKGAVGRTGGLERRCHPAPQKAQLERAGVQIKRGFRDQLGRDILLLRSQEAHLR